MSAEHSRGDLAVRNPLTGQHDYRIVPLSAADIAARVQALRRAQPAWAARGVAERIDVLNDFVAALDHHAAAISAALAIDTGRQLLAQQELGGVKSGIARWSALAPALLDDRRREAAAMPAAEIVETAQPYPVVGAISPWNFPLLLSFIDAVPALLAGCAVFIKPSEVTPRFIEPLRQAIDAVPALAAVLDVGAGDGASGAALVDVVDAVAFTGSVATGKKVAAAAAGRLIPAFLELGGKDPAIVLAGADIDRATTSLLRASIAATGQACQSIERIYVDASIIEPFVAALVSKANAVALTRDDPAGIIGPLIFAQQAAIIREHLADAVANGATIECGGDVLDDNGAYWIRPTVVTGVDHTMALMRDETFGPIMPVMPFATEDDAVRLANDTSFGLSAAVFGPDEASALALGRRIAAGGVSVNDAGLTAFLFETEKSAFGSSGLGPSRVGPAGLTRFLRRQSLYLNRGAVTPIHVMAESG
ncbi:MAG: aldehyde dehydrogenase family protein [Pseudomonadota bacterium]